MEQLSQLGLVYHTVGPAPVGPPKQPVCAAEPPLPQGTTCAFHMPQLLATSLPHPLQPAPRFLPAGRCPRCPQHAAAAVFGVAVLQPNRLLADRLLHCMEGLRRWAGCSLLPPVTARRVWRPQALLMRVLGRSSFAVFCQACADGSGVLPPPVRCRNRPAGLGAGRKLAARDAEPCQQLQRLAARLPVVCLPSYGFSSHADAPPCLQPTPQCARFYPGVVELPPRQAGHPGGLLPLPSQPSAQIRRRC